MSTVLLELDVARKRDVLLVRQRARQICRLLGFEVAEQGLTAAAVFHLAYQALRSGRPFQVRFELVAGTFRASVCGASAPAQSQVQKKLAANAQRLCHEDIAFVMKEVQRRRFRPFEEIYLQNTDLLMAAARGRERASGRMRQRTDGRSGAA